MPFLVCQPAVQISTCANSTSSSTTSYPSMGKHKCGRDDHPKILRALVATHSKLCTKLRKSANPPRYHDFVVITGVSCRDASAHAAWLEDSVTNATSTIAFLKRQKRRVCPLPVFVSELSAAEESGSHQSDDDIKVPQPFFLEWWYPFLVRDAQANFGIHAVGHCTLAKPRRILSLGSLTARTFGVCLGKALQKFAVQLGTAGSGTLTASRKRKCRRKVHVVLHVCHSAESPSCSSSSLATRSMMGQVFTAISDQLTESKHHDTVHGPSPAVTLPLDVHVSGFRGLYTCLKNGAGVLVKVPQDPSVSDLDSATVFREVLYEKAMFTMRDVDNITVPQYFADP